MPVKGIYGNDIWRGLSLEDKIDIVNELSDEGKSANDIAEIVGLSWKRVCLLRGMYRKRIEKSKVKKGDDNENIL